jgi:O-antigen ligase
MLVRQEVHLAKAELTEKVTKAGRDVALIAGGGLLAYTGVLALVAALILVLANWMAPWLAALLVGLVFVGIAAILIVTGLNDLKEINPTPQRTVATIKEDKEWLTRQLN